MLLRTEQENAGIGRQNGPVFRFGKSRPGSG
jgi:hypothetical protein